MNGVNEIFLETFAGLRRVRRTLRGMLETLPAGTLDREFDWCGTGSIKSALLHICGCEMLWVEGVLKGEPKFDYRGVDGEIEIPVMPGDAHCEKAGISAGLGGIFEFQDALTDSTEKYIRGADLATPRSFSKPWRAEFEARLVPWQVLSHVVTHEFHHKGQIVAMCRALGLKDIPETDFM